ncbi:MAG: hypothetical protein ABI835_14960 [Chloroflexota bacterium]
MLRRWATAPSPGWQGVEPGVTARGEALALLDAAGWTLDDECNAAVYERCYAFRHDGVRASEPDAVAFVYVAREQVAQIALLRFGLSLGDLWLTFGAPDYVAIPPERIRAASFDTALWFGSTGISTRIGFPCPADFRDMLRRPVSTILVWARGTAMRETDAGTIAELRRALREGCG